VPDAETADRGGMGFGAIPGDVVGHDALHDDTVLGEPGNRPLQKTSAGRARFVGEDLEIGDPAGVVDGDVDELPTGLVGPW
jgi:hypothetical protein